MTIPKKATKPFFLLLLICVGGIVAAIISILWLSKIPSDFSRTQTLLSFVKNQTPSEATLVFGNSVTMDGFNANIFIKKSCSQTCFNLSSPGQNQLESLLLISSITSKPKNIIHLYLATDLNRQDFLSKQVINNFLLYGYKLNDFAKETLLKTNNATSISDFETNKLTLAFSSRWLLSNYINTNFRKLLRNDLALDHLATELYYPRNYTSKFPESQRMPLIRQFNPQTSVSDFSLDSTKLALIKKIGEFVNAKGAKYIVVIAPINPELDNYKNEYFEGIDNFCKKQSFPNIQFINFSNLLTKDDFVDHIHPSESGANKITNELAKILNECSSKQ
jgi:hypothetical protein